jgi:hypothetical protein
MFSRGVCRNVGRTVPVTFFTMLTAERGGGETTFYSRQRICIILDPSFSVSVLAPSFYNLTSVADPGYLSRIPDPTFFHPGSELSIPDPHQRIEVF